MSAAQHSRFCKLIVFLCHTFLTWCEGSALIAGLHRFGLACGRAWADSGFGRAWRNSALVGFFLREGVLSRSWRHSLICRGLSGLLNLPTRGLQRAYRRAPAAFEHSGAARFLLAAADGTPLLVGWLMLAVMVIPYEAWNNLYALGGLLFCFLLTILAGTRRPDFRLSLAAVGPWLFAFAVLVVAAWILSTDRDASTRFLFFHLTNMLCVLILVTTIEHRDQLVRLLGVSSAAMAIMSAVAFGQRIAGVEVDPTSVDVTLDLNRGMPGRVFAFYENPNSFGEVLLMLLPLTFALILCARTWWGRTLALVSGAMGCMAIAMTYSRAAWVGLVAAVFLFLLLWKKKLVPIAILLGLASLLVLPHTVSNRILSIFSSSDTSTNSRIPYYEAAWRLIQQEPVLGAGLGSDTVRDAIGKANYFYGLDLFVHCHNIYLQMWCETGIFGLLTLVGGILWTVRQGARTLKNTCSTPQTRLALIGGVSSVFGAMICGIGDYIWSYPRVMLIFWFVAGIALAAIRLAALEDRDRA